MARGIRVVAIVLAVVAVLMFFATDPRPDAVNQKATVALGQSSVELALTKAAEGRLDVSMMLEVATPREIKLRVVSRAEVPLALVLFDLAPTAFAGEMPAYFDQARLSFAVNGDLFVPMGRGGVKLCKLMPGKGYDLTLKIKVAADESGGSPTSSSWRFVLGLGRL